MGRANVIAYRGCSDFTLARAGALVINRSCPAGVVVRSIVADAPISGTRLPPASRRDAAEPEPRITRRSAFANSPIDVARTECQAKMCDLRRSPWGSLRTRPQPF